MTTNIIKEQHLKEIREALKELKTATKPQLAQYTGLSVVTINSLTRSLLASDEIREEKETVSNGGRPAAVYSLNENYKMALIFGTWEKCGKDFITASVINLYGELAEPYQQFTELNIENLDASISYYTKKYPCIQLAAFALPAKIQDGRLIFCDYSQLDQYPLKEHITKNFHLPCFIENDIRIAILGYFIKNKSQQIKNIAGIYFPQKYSAGIGLYVNGGLFSGTNGVAGEIELLPMFREIDWKTRTSEQTLELIEAVCIMYNPDTVVIYDAFMTEEMFAKIKERFADGYHRHFRPEFVLIPEIEEDYLCGLKEFALHHL